MEIYLDKLDSITQTKYKEFKEKVQELLTTYQETDSERFKEIYSDDYFVIYEVLNL